MFERKLKKTSIMLDEDDYKLFQKICKLNNTDASKEFRKFIASYIKDNQQLAMKIKTYINEKS